MTNKKKYSVWNAKKQKNILIIFIVLILSGYMFFFMSPLLFSDSSEIKQTPFNKNQSLGNGRTVSVSSWEYSQKQALMEVQLDISNTNYDGLDLYDFAVVTKSGSYKSVKIYQVVQDSDFVVLLIKGIPENFKITSLRMAVHGGDGTIIKLYTSEDTVTYCKEIKEKTKKDYYIEKIDNKIAVIEKDNKKLSEEIKKIKDTITNINKKNVELSKSEKYQTENEIINTENQIANNNNRISNFTDQINSLQISKIENVEKITKLREQQQNIK